MAFPSALELDAIRNAGNLASRSSALRDCFVGKPENCFIALMFARDMAIPPMLALTRGYVVKGRFELDTEVKLDIVMQRIPDFDYEVVKLDATECHVRGGIKGKAQHDGKFTAAQAKAAGLDGYTGAYAEDKLRWRAVSRLLKFSGAGRAMLMLPALVDEPADEDEVKATIVTPAAAAPQPSGAVVVEDGGVGATDQPAPPVSTAVPEDWRGRLLRAVATKHKLTPPGAHKNSYSRWASNYADFIVGLCNEYYREKGESLIAGLVSLPPMDHQKIAEWFEAKIEREGAGAATAPAGMDAGPSPGALAVLPPDEEPEEEDESTQGAKLAEQGLDRVLAVLSAMARADKTRVFWQPVKDRPVLVDGKILEACGYVARVQTPDGAETAPKSQWLDVIAKSKPAFIAVCRMVVIEAKALKVDWR
jgi:hypothetical protein